MKYAKKLIELITNRDNVALQKWIYSHPALERADIMREAKWLLEVIMDVNGYDPNTFEGFDQFGDKIDEYEEAILNKKLNRALNDLESDGQE
jgi:hypothetical protein